MPKDKKSKFLGKVKKWSNKKLIEKFSELTTRVQVRPHFVQSEPGLVTHIVLEAVAGENKVASDPLALEWPLMVMPKPDAFMTQDEGFNDGSN